MTGKLYEYLKKEWKYNNHKKYQKYFEQWVTNLTDSQIFIYKKLWLK